MIDDQPRLTPKTAKVLDLLLSESGLSGADISKRTGMLSGTLYPLLFRLEDAGWLSSEWEAGEPSELGRPRRRFYSVTSVGRAHVKSVAGAQAALFARLAAT